jgi:hypothetical protein
LTSNWEGTVCAVASMAAMLMPASSSDDDVYLNKWQQKVLQNLFSTRIMQTSQYGISKGNKPTNIKSYRYNRTAQHPIGVEGWGLDGWKEGGSRRVRTKGWKDRDNGIKLRNRLEGGITSMLGYIFIRSCI